MTIAEAEKQLRGYTAEDSVCAALARVKKRLSEEGPDCIISRETRIAYHTMMAEMTRLVLS